MRERTHGAARVRSARVGRATLRDATVVVEEDAIVLLGAREERAARVPLSSIRAVSAEGERVTLTLAGNSTIVLLSDAPDELQNLLLAACRALPELTRGLRGLGSQRRARNSRPTGADEQHRFFATLLDARREAADAPTPGAVVSAFDAQRMRRSLDAALHAFAQARAPENPPARRALEAELSDAAEPFVDALDALDGAARDARSALDDVVRWRAWAETLMAAFEAADRAWMAVDRVLESPSMAHAFVPAPGKQRGARRGPRP